MCFLKNIRQNAQKQSKNVRGKIEKYAKARKKLENA